MSTLVFFILLLIVLILYNKIVKVRLKVNQAKSTIDVYLTQRFDLIPNLIECVREYKIYEQDILGKMVEMRDLYMEDKKLVKGKI